MSLETKYINRLSGFYSHPCGRQILSLLRLPIPPPGLTDQQIADVLTYVRISFGNKAIAITPGDAKYIRARTKQESL